MSRPLRPVDDGLVYHVINRGNNRQDVFHKPADFQAFPTPDIDPEMLQIAEDYRVAQMIYDARRVAGLSQQELAEAIGTTQSVIFSA